MRTIPKPKAGRVSRRTRASTSTGCRTTAACSSTWRRTCGRPASWSAPSPRSACCAPTRPASGRSRRRWSTSWTTNASTPIARCASPGATRTELPGFEQDDYVPLSGANDRPVADILAEYAAVREATIALFRGLPEEALLRSGVANGNLASVRALGYHLAGHEVHHIGIVRERLPPERGMRRAQPSTNAFSRPRASSHVREMRSRHRRASCNWSGSRAQSRSRP